MTDWTELSPGALAGIDQWYLVTLEEAAVDDVRPSLLACVLRQGYVVCETIDPYDAKTTLVVLAVRGPELTLVTPSSRVAFAPEAHPDGQSWFVTFSSTDPMLELPSLPPGAIAFDADGVRIGESATVTTSLGFAPWWRDWAWAWTPTYGPALLDVLVDAPLDAIEAWFAEHASRFYAYTRTDEHWGRRFDSTISGDALLRLSPGIIHFIRGYATPSARQLAADRRLLEGLIAGALPVTGFDVIDGDYDVVCATGYSKEELAAYLDAAPDLTYEVPHPWRRGLGRLDVDASLARDEAEVEARLAARLGCAAVHDYLVSTPICDLPRVIEVRHPGELAVTALAARLLRVKPRLKWRWTAVFARGTRTVHY